MPDRAKIISQLASKAKMDPSSAVKEKDVKLMKKVEPLPTPKDKEAEVEDLLSESEMEMEKKAEYASKEKANYDRIKKQGMSDQGIVNLDQLAAAGKKAYRKVKSKVKSMME
jgi:hypothetical protein